MRAYVLTPRGEKQPAAPRPHGTDLEPQVFPYEQLQDIVGGYIEIVRLTDDVLMVVNEEGKLMDLPYNAEATKLLVKCFPNTTDFIVGNALICEATMID